MMTLYILLQKSVGVSQPEVGRWYKGRLSNGKEVCHETVEMLIISSLILGYRDFSD